nr:hypothetical protein [uncultured Rhodopila sp.]
MHRFAAQHGHGYIAVLNETAAVQSAGEAAAGASLLLSTIRIGAVARRFPQQSESSSHLRLGFVILTRLTRRVLIG